METKHTPGPWYRHGEFILDTPRLRDGSVICKIGSWPRQWGDLIAAAPELLEALRECVTDENAHALANPTAATMQRRIHAISDIARAAIAKAEGRS